MKRSGKILGIALGPAGALVATVVASDKNRVDVLAEFTFPDGVGIEQPEQLGKALAAFLKGAHISERDAAIGLPAKWLLTRRKDLPPANAATAADSLRLQVETEFPGDHNLVVDFAGQASTAGPSNVLLVATSKTYIENALAMAKAAGLRVRSITSTGVALGQAAGAAGKSAGVMLSVSAAGSELVVCHDGMPTQLRHLSVTDDVAVLAGEIRRGLIGLSLNGDANALSIWDRKGSGLGDALGQRLSMSVKPGDARAMFRAEQPVDGRFAPAVAVAVAALDGMPVDFLHSRLAPPPVRNNRLWVRYALGVAAVIIVLVSAGWIDISLRETAVAKVNAQITASRAERAKAGPMVARVKTARDFMASSPDYSTCLADLTALFPNEDVVWAIKFSLHADMKGEISFRAPDVRVADALHKRMQAQKRFTDIWQPASDTDKKSGDVTYSISFTYKPDAK